MRQAGRFTPTIPIFGCSTSRRTRWWASQICRRNWAVCSANVCWTSGASHSNVTPCILWRTARTDLYALAVIRQSGIQLTAPEITISDTTGCASTPTSAAKTSYLLSRYSLAVHVLDSSSGERVGQGDSGVGPGFIVPFRSEIDISALPPGDYELHIALYDWQTGARLSARDLVTDEVSDIHTLHRFQHN